VNKFIVVPSVPAGLPVTLFAFTTNGSVAVTAIGFAVLDCPFTSLIASHSGELPVLALATIPDDGVARSPLPPPK